LNSELKGQKILWNGREKLIDAMFESPQ